MTEETDISKITTYISSIVRNKFTSQSSEKQEEIKNAVSAVFAPIIFMLRQEGHTNVTLDKDRVAATALDDAIASVFYSEEEISFGLSDEVKRWSTKFDIMNARMQPDEHQQDSHDRHNQSEQLDEEPNLYEISFSSDEEDERLTVKEMLLIAAFICSITLYCFF